MADLPAEAVEAAAKVLYAERWPGDEWENEPLELILEWREQARTVLAAAMPAVRACIADQIAALDWYVLDSDASDTANTINDWVRSAYETAASVARGGSDA